MEHLGQPSWITLSQTSGTAGVTATVTVSANSKNFGQNARSGVLTIHAGNLQYRLHVKQEPACGFGNNMKLMRIGNNNYMTTRVTNGGVCWMIDASKEGGPNMAARPRAHIHGRLPRSGLSIMAVFPTVPVPMVGGFLRHGRLST